MRKKEMGNNELNFASMLHPSLTMKKNQVSNFIGTSVTKTELVVGLGPRGFCFKD